MFMFKLEGVKISLFLLVATWLCLGVVSVSALEKKQTKELETEELEYVNPRAEAAKEVQFEYSMQKLKLNTEMILDHYNLYASKIKNSFVTHLEEKMISLDEEPDVEKSKSLLPQQNVFLFQEESALQELVRELPVRVKEYGIRLIGDLLKEAFFNINKNTVQYDTSKEPPTLLLLLENTKTKEEVKIIIATNSEVYVVSSESVISYKCVINVTTPNSEETKSYVYTIKGNEKQGIQDIRLDITLKNKTKPSVFMQDHLYPWGVKSTKKDGFKTSHKYFVKKNKESNEYVECRLGIRYFLNWIKDRLAKKNDEKKKI